MKTIDTDLIHPNGINCIFARDKLDKNPDCSSPSDADKLFETIKSSIPQINTVENEYYSKYLSFQKGKEKNKILVVEDRDEKRDYLCSILHSANFQVIEAKDSDAAIRLAYSEVPDLIICELLMPIVSGYGVIASLCHSTVTSNIPVLFITAHFEQTDISSGILLFKDRETIELLTKEKLLEVISDKLVQSAQV